MEPISGIGLESILALLFFRSADHAMHDDRTFEAAVDTGVGAIFCLHIVAMAIF